MIKEIKKVLKSWNKETKLNLWAKQWNDRVYINGGSGKWKFWVDSFGDPHFDWYEPGSGPRLLAARIKDAVTGQRMTIVQFDEFCKIPGRNFKKR